MATAQKERPTVADQLHEKYRVERTDGGAVGPCFILEYERDPHARAALRTYAESCRDDKPGLSADLFRRLLAIEQGRYVTADQVASARARYKE